MFSVSNNEISWSRDYKNKPGSPLSGLYLILVTPTFRLNPEIPRFLLLIDRDQLREVISPYSTELTFQNSDHEHQRP